MATNQVLQAFADQAKVFIGTINTGIDGIAGDIASLKAKILELQNTPGTLTPEDTALLNEIQGMTEALAGRVTELDALTPPVAPPVV